MKTGRSDSDRATKSHNFPKVLDSEQGNFSAVPTILLTVVILLIERLVVIATV